MSTATETRKKSIVQPFGIEVDERNNSDVLLAGIPGCRLRSAIKASRTVKDVVSGQDMIPTDPARHLGKLPPVPGMQLHVNPAKLSYTVIDPLHDDEDLCERIRLAMRSDGRPNRPNKVRGAPPLKGTLDKHRMKTLVRELLWFIRDGDMKVIKGPKPEMEDVDGLPGDYLLNPGSLAKSLQPEYEKDLDEYVDQLTRSGG